MTDLPSLLHTAAQSAPPPGDLLAGVIRHERRRAHRQRTTAVCASALALAAIAGGAAWWAQPAAVRVQVLAGSTTSPAQPPTSDSTAAGKPAKVPPVGAPVPGDPYGLSGGRVVGVPVDIGFGLAVAPATAVPRRSMADAYALFLAWSRSPAGLRFEGHPTISLAMATEANYKPSHNALVWVVRWPGICAAAAPATHLNRDHEPTTRPCQYWAVFSDTTGQAVTAGSG